MKLGFDWPNNFGEEDFLKWWTTLTDGRTDGRLGLDIFWVYSECFTLCLFIILLVQFGLLSGHLLGNSCPLG